MQACLLAGPNLIPDGSSQDLNKNEIYLVQDL